MLCSPIAALRTRLNQFDVDGNSGVVKAALKPGVDRRAPVKKRRENFQIEIRKRDGRGLGVGSVCSRPPPPPRARWGGGSANRQTSSWFGARWLHRGAITLLSR